MKTLVLSIALSAALFGGCKKKEETKAAAGSAAVAGSAAGSAVEAAGATAQKAAEAAGSAAEAAGSAAAAAGSAAEAAAKMAEAAGGAAAAAGAAVPRPASVTDAHVAIADKMVTTLTEMATNVGAAGKDCKKAAAAIKASVDKMKPIKAEVEKLDKLGKDDPAVKAWFEANYMTKIMGAMGPMMTVGQACASDKDFMDAMKGMEMGGH